MYSITKHVIGNYGCTLVVALLFVYQKTYHINPERPLQAMNFTCRPVMIPWALRFGPVIEAMQNFSQLVVLLLNICSCLAGAGDSNPAEQ